VFDYTEDSQEQIDADKALETANGDKSLLQTAAEAVGLVSEKKKAT
jgi:hypothetical protein